ncbi:hypothetical protein NQ176_g2633 [Zarea fungicola]|uniref:Uncharacterized protein n=1 Tax=Zarea fungicola TaxID=93591 RepID=A0ACC1NQ14_9HYPO|nr:hypothetical protein NQ176_g2633 [Lecanicillium fungicola]
MNLVATVSAKDNHASARGSSQERVAEEASAGLPTPTGDVPLPSHSASPVTDHDVGDETEIGSRVYFGQQSVMRFRPRSPSTTRQHSSTQKHRAEVYSEAETTMFRSIIKSWTTPSPSLGTILIDLYFSKLFVHAPIFDPSDFHPGHSSQLLHQAVYFCGSLMRPCSSYTGNITSQELFGRIKLLIYFRPENDMFTVLKALCSLSCWSLLVPQRATLDSPWQWVGQAIRLAVQLGLHKEETYLSMPRSACARRIWWFLQRSETILALCKGRPAMLQKHSVQLPQVSDFESPSVDAISFCYTTKLFEQALRKIEKLAASGQDASAQDILSLLDALAQWTDKLPDELRMYSKDGKGPRPHSRVVSNAHKILFVSIILVSHLPGASRRNSMLHATAAAASSCLARIYEEILHRDEVAYLLPADAWFMLVCGGAGIYCSSPAEDKGRSSRAEVEILRGVLTQMATKYPSAQVAMETLDRMQQDMSRKDERPGPPTNFDEPSVGAGRNFSSLSQSRHLEATEGIQFDFRSLFPVPNEFCAALGSIERASVGLNPVMPDLMPGNMGQQDLGLMLQWSDLTFENFDADSLELMGFGEEQSTLWPA